MNQQSVTDKVVIVTGAGQGLGEAIALEFAREGAAVALLERNPETLEATRVKIAAAGGEAKAFGAREVSVPKTLCVQVC